MEFTAKCKRCGKYNNVAIKTDWLTDKPKCVQCGWLLTPSQEAEIKPPAFDIPDIVLVLGGIVLGPAGLFASLFLGMSKDKFMKAKAKVAAAWAFIGCVLYLLLFMYVPPAKNLMMEIYYKILAFGGR